MLFWIVCVYSVLAAVFYTVLTVTAKEMTASFSHPQHKWQRARRMAVGSLRRLRPRFAVRPPQRGR